VIIIMNMLAILTILKPWVGLRYYEYFFLKKSELYEL
jgi:hypothetical protein